MRLLLCSASERRRDLSKRLSLKTIFFKPKVRESSFKINPGFAPEDLVMKLAFAKALEGVKRYNSKSVIALGADTIVVLGKEIIGKPENTQDAEKTLKKLSGNWHKVLTGIALINTATLKCVIDFEKSRTKMRRLSYSEIKSHSKKHLDKAGAYAVQEEDAFIEKLVGDYYNVVGFPVKKITGLIRALTSLQRP